MADRITSYSGQIDNVAVVYNIYRIALPAVLLLTYFSNPDAGLLGALNPDLFVQITVAYLAFAVLIALLWQNLRSPGTRQQLLTGSFIVDILTTTFIIYVCGGIISGLGLLLIVTMASGSILIRGRVSTFLAAVAALSLIYSELYLALTQDNPPNQFIQTGILGTILFATSLYIQAVTDRIYRAAALADQQARDILDLEKLNNEIIQRMRTGVVVVDNQNRIVSMNSSARSALQPLLETSQTDTGPATADDREGTRSRASASQHLDREEKPLLPRQLSEQLNFWKQNPKRQPAPIKVPNSTKQLQLNFAFLKPEEDSDTLIFMEDNRQIVQRVRQMKLASLGRLTASIAHEVRNPLAAISHASQLLRESKSIGDDDKRMVEIILDHCARVNSIIEDVLDASRHDDTSATRVSLNEWLQRFVESYQATHENCDEITLTLDPNSSDINVITTQLAQVLNNLFDNGLRYSKKQTGRATLTVIAGTDTRLNDMQSFIHVIDDGPGISEDDESSLFEPFHTTESSGTGLGLYISKELCEANQSQLQYSQRSDGRSCFSIFFSHPDRSVA